MRRPFHITLRSTYPNAIADILKALGATLEAAGDGAILAAFDETVFRIVASAHPADPGTANNIELTFTVSTDEQIEATNPGFTHKFPNFLPIENHDGTLHVLTFGIGEIIFHLVDEHPSPILAHGQTAGQATAR